MSKFDDAIKQLKLNNKSIVSIDLSSGKIDDAGAIRLAEALKSNSSLKELNLDYNQIGGAGAAAIGEALKTNAALTRLGIGYNQIGDAGAAAINKQLIRIKAIPTEEKDKIKAKKLADAKENIKRLKQQEEKEQEDNEAPEVKDATASAPNRAAKAEADEERKAKTDADLRLAEEAIDKVKHALNERKNTAAEDKTAIQDQIEDLVDKVAGFAANSAVNPAALKLIAAKCQEVASAKIVTTGTLARLEAAIYQVITRADSQQEDFDTEITEKLQKINGNITEVFSSGSNKVEKNRLEAEVAALKNHIQVLMSSYLLDKEQQSTIIGSLVYLENKDKLTSKNLLKDGKKHQAVNAKVEAGKTEFELKLSALQNYINNLEKQLNDPSSDINHPLSPVTSPKSTLSIHSSGSEFDEKESDANPSHELAKKMAKNVLISLRATLKTTDRQGINCEEAEFVDNLSDQIEKNAKILRDYTISNDAKKQKLIRAIKDCLIQKNKDAPDTEKLFTVDATNPHIKKLDIYGLNLTAKVLKEVLELATTELEIYAVTNIEYDNPVLNNPEALEEFYKNYGAEATNRLVNLGSFTALDDGGLQNQHQGQNKSQSQLKAHYVVLDITCMQNDILISPDRHESEIIGNDNFGGNLNDVGVEII